MTAGGRRPWIAYLAVACVATLAATQVPGRADSWPMFRSSPALLGVASGELPSPLVLRWTYEAEDSIESSAAIVDGTVYVGSMPRPTERPRAATRSSCAGDDGAPVRLRLVAALRDSILQGESIVADPSFLRAFPDREGFRFFLLDVPAAGAAALVQPAACCRRSWRCLPAGGHPIGVRS